MMLFVAVLNPILITAIRAIRHYRTVLNKLVQYEKLIRRRLSFEDINIDFYNQFRNWIYGRGILIIISAVLSKLSNRFIGRPGMWITCII